MLVLIEGANNSGKSHFAEQYCVSAAQVSGGRKLYIAAMIPFGAEGAARVQKHLRQRSGLGFDTIEEPYSLDSIPAGKNDTVLLEDLSNLLANRLFGLKDAGAESSCLTQVLDLSRRCALLAVVTISGLAPEAGQDEATKGYIASLARLNDALRRAASEAFFMKEGVAHAAL